MKARIVRRTRAQPAAWTRRVAAPPGPAGRMRRPSRKSRVERQLKSEAVAVAIPKGRRWRRGGSPASRRRRRGKSAHRAAEQGSPQVQRDFRPGVAGRPVPVRGIDRQGGSHPRRLGAVLRPDGRRERLGEQPRSSRGDRPPPAAARGRPPSSSASATSGAHRAAHESADQRRRPQGPPPEPARRRRRRRWRSPSHRVAAETGGAVGERAPVVEKT
jgi:hypothetical protein